MSRGLIIHWNFTNSFNNGGVIAGCSPDIHGGFFGFVISGVIHPGLRNLLIITPSFNRGPDCAMGPDPMWVDFIPGMPATGISPVFPGTLLPTPGADVAGGEMEVLTETLTRFALDATASSAAIEPQAEDAE
jgi:hypothetical protein